MSWPALTVTANCLTKPDDCPLCREVTPEPFHDDGRRSYLRCVTCRLVFVPESEHLSAAAERAVYELHRNGPDDPGYRRFLSRLFEPLRGRLPVDAAGLDFGCGPGPTLSHMFAETGSPMALYDPFFAPDRAVLDDCYDFITLSEVAEHLSQPGAEFKHLWSRLRPGGWLGIMTKRVLDAEAFARWHYKNDPTHICFFADETFSFLAAHWQTTAEFCGKDVVLLQKPSTLR